jgi:hypothetical protein
LVEQYPEDMRAEATETVKHLRKQYRLYQGVAAAARDALECGLHEIEKALNDAGVDTGSDLGYQERDMELPSRLRTDIHA